MSSTCSQLIRQTILLPLGVIILGSSTIFGFSNQVFAVEVDISKNPCFQSNKPHPNKDNIHKKLGSTTIFVPETPSDNCIP